MNTDPRFTDSLRVALDPKSIAVIGASDNPNKVGGRPLRFLQRFGFKGQIYPVNPTRSETQGLRTWPRVQDLPAAAEALLEGFAELLDREQQVNQAGALTYRYLGLGHPVDGLVQTLGHLLLREDAEFHSYQMFEAGLRQYRALQPAQPAAAQVVLVAVARYLAAHAPTARAQRQTYEIARRLHRGEKVYEDDSLPPAA